MTGHTNEQMGPGPILQLATGYWASMALLTLNELGVFPALAGDRKGVGDLAEALSVDERALGFLLDTGLQLGLLDLDERGTYGNSPLAETYLVPGKPTYLGGGLKYALDGFQVWGKLPDAIRTGQAQIEVEEYLGEDRERTRRFVYGMHHRGKGMARAIAEVVDLTGRSRLLDIGGGSGVYSELLCKRYPALTATLIDLPGVVAVAREILEAEGVADRVELEAGDYHHTDFGTGYDVAMLNGVLHRETKQDCRELVARAAKALEPGGMLVAADVMLDETGHGPLFPTLFALNMLLTAPGGGAHTVEDHVAWMEAAGLEEVEVITLPPPAYHTVVIGHRRG